MRTLPMPQVLRAMGLTNRGTSHGEWSRHLVRLPEPGESANRLLASLPPFLPSPPVARKAIPTAAR